jgi:hypothetical protein
VPSLSLDSTYPFPVQRITLQAPPGVLAKLTSLLPPQPALSPQLAPFNTRNPRKSSPSPPCTKFIFYDRKRQWLYLTTTDHIDVFDLSATQFHSTPITPPGGPLPNAALRGLDLTPDASQLVAADFGAQSIYLLNPDAATGTTIPVGGVAGFLNSGPARVAVTSTQTVFVAMSGEGSSSSACSSSLSQLNLSAIPPTVQPAPQPQVTSLTGTPRIQADATGSQIFLAYNAAGGGPVGLWSAAAPNQFTTSLAKESAIDLTAARDGTMFTSRTSTVTEIRGANLTIVATPASPELEQIPARIFVPGLALHPSGALLYQPFLTGPAPAAPPRCRNPRRRRYCRCAHWPSPPRLFLPEPLATLSTDVDALHGSFLAIDENGQRIFALTSSGLTVVQLATVPLSIGTISPTSAPAAGGIILTIRSSGFQSGAAVTIGGKPAPVTFKDLSTLTLITPQLAPGPQQIAVTNPNGDSYTLDAAFTAN